MRRSTLLDLGYCTEVDRYRTTDFRDCISDCTDYSDDDSEISHYENGLDHANRLVCKCASTPKAYVKLIDQEDPEGPWKCVSFEQCVEEGFVDISSAMCLPIDDADTKCSGSLLGDLVTDAAGNEYLSFKQLVDGKCECLPGVGPSQAADGQYCNVCNVTGDNHVAAGEIVAPYDPQNSCRCEPSFVKRFQPDYGYFECLPECPDEPYALLSRDGEICFL